VVFNKADLSRALLPKWLKNAHSVSAELGTGIEDLWKEMASRLADLGLGREGSLLPTATQAMRLQEVEKILEQMEAGFGTTPPEYLAERNREAMSQKAGVKGAVTTDEVLDRVFGEFCIGK
jgi:tRNA modification GTPase